MKKRGILPVKRTVIKKTKYVEKAPVRVFDIYDDKDGLTIIEGNFQFDVSELPHCCGVYEIGNIEIFNDDDYNTLSGEENFTKALDEGIKRIVQRHTVTKQTFKGLPACHTLIANLVPNDACNLLRDSFARTGLFSIVKEFKNSSGSNITMWISTN